MIYSAAGSVSQIYSSSSSSYQGRMDMYDLVDMAVYPEQITTEDWNSGKLPSSERSARETLSNLLLLTADNSDSSTSFFAVYVGFNDELGRVELSMNGKPIERVAHKAVVSAELEFLPVGKTGIIYYAPGVLDAFTAEVGEDNRPYIPGLAREDSSTVKLRAFRIPDADKINLESLTFTANYIDGEANAYLYNTKTGEWDEQPGVYFTVTENAPDYVNADGEVYVRVQSTETRGSDLYVYVDRPYLEVKGRVK